MLKGEVNHALEVSGYHAQAMNETMGDRIKNLRQSRRLSQDALGDIVGVKGASVSLWESGATTNIRPENLLAICSYFSCDPWWLVHGQKDSHLMPPPPFPEGRRRTAGK
jgi:transcriptional regulator with XRE-family HTH domain